MDFLINTFEQGNILSIAIRLTLSIILGGIIGIDRGRRRHAAGFRTHILVCMGAALVMMTNIFIVQELAPGSDPTRIAAQVVSGIGFLGVGTIIVTRNKQIRGLTTAAGLWASACLGLTIGAGYYLTSLIACILIIIVMTLLNSFEKYVYQKAKVMDIYMELNDIQSVSGFISFARDNQIKTGNIELTRSETIGENSVSVLMTLYLPKRHDHSEILSVFGKIDGVKFIEEM